jgi:hypothetical protein
MTALIRSITHLQLLTRRGYINGSTITLLLLPRQSAEVKLLRSQLSVTELKYRTIKVDDSCIYTLLSVETWPSCWSLLE